MPNDKQNPLPIPPSDARRGSDDALLADLTAPPTLEDSQEAYDFWTKRRAELPAYKHAERREAEAMAARWKERLKAAQRERYGVGLLEQLLDLLGLRWRPNPRKLIAGLSILALIIVLITIALIIAVILLWPDLQPIIRTITGGNRGEGGG